MCDNNWACEYICTRLASYRATRNGGILYVYSTLLPCGMKRLVASEIVRTGRWRGRVKWVHGYSIWPRRFFSGLPTANRIHRVRRRRAGYVPFYSPNLTYFDACVSMRGIFGYSSGAIVFFFISNTLKRPIFLHYHPPPSSTPKTLSS